MPRVESTVSNQSVLSLGDVRDSGVQGEATAGQREPADTDSLGVRETRL